MILPFHELKVFWFCCHVSVDTFTLIWAQSKYIQRSHFCGKTVRLAGGNVLSKLATALKRSIHPPPQGTLHFNTFTRGGGLSLGHLLRTWRTEKIPYAKLTWSETSVCKYSVLLANALMRDIYPPSFSIFSGGEEKQGKQTTKPLRRRVTMKSLIVRKTFMYKYRYFCKLLWVLKQLHPCN
jgi:hypothetical protein